MRQRILACAPVLVICDAHNGICDVTDSILTLFLCEVASLVQTHKPGIENWA